MCYAITSLSSSFRRTPAHRYVESIILVYYYLDDYLVLLHYPSISATPLSITVGLAGLNINYGSCVVSRGIL